MAANVIDSLVVHLLLDVQQFIKAQRQAQQAMTQTRQQAATHAKSVEQQVRQVTETIGKLKTQALTLLAIFLGGRGIKEFATYLTQTDASLGRFSRAFNVSTEVVSKWRTAIELGGGRAEEADESFANLSNTLTAFSAGKGDPAIVSWLHRLGVERLAPLDKQVDQLTKGLQKMGAAGGEAAKTAFWFAGQVGATPGMANLILNPRFKEFMEIAERIGTVTAEDAKAAEERLKDWKEFLNVAMRLGRVFATFLTPALEKLTDLLERWLGIAKPGEGGEASTENLRRRFGDPTKGPLGRMLKPATLEEKVEQAKEKMRRGQPGPFSDRWAPVYDAIRSGIFDPQGRNNILEQHGSVVSGTGFGLFGPGGFYGSDRGQQTVNHSEMHIAQLTVNTQAKDADTIARDISSAIRRHAMGMVVNSGLA